MCLISINFRTGFTRMEIKDIKQHMNSLKNTGHAGKSLADWNYINLIQRKKNDRRARFLSFFKNFPFFFPPTFSVFIFVFLLPVIQAILFCMAIGHDPTSLKLAVVNEELDASQGREYCNYTTACTYSMYSCRFLRFINNETISQVIIIDF